MASTQISTTEQQVVETTVEEKPAAEEARRGFWEALRWRTQIIFWNYMGLQAQMGLYGSDDESGDP